MEINRKTLPQEVIRTRANVKSTQDTLKDAEKNYKRFEELFRKGVVTEKERDTLKLNYDIAQSQVIESESALKLAEGNLTKIDEIKQNIEVADRAN